MKTIHKTIATFFGLGYAPFAPGTFGAIGGVAVVYGLQLLNWPYVQIQWTIVFLILIFTILGIIATDALESEWGKDPSRVVIDEALGLWVSILWAPLGYLPLLLGFILFRLFDIWKPLGIRKLEQLSGGIGVMADDILAGVYAAISLQFILYFIP